MSRNEVIQAYLNGRIGRREFMRLMTATGASLVAAAALADDLRAAPGRQSASSVSAYQDDVYGEDDVYDDGDDGDDGGGVGGDSSGDDDDEVSALPSTGIGGATSGSGLFKPFALAASAAAAVGLRLRRSSTRESETE